MSDNKRDLVLVTATFPFGYGETFLESEILILSQCFRKIYLLPLATTNYSFSRVLPQNCIVKKVSSEYRKSKLRHLVYLLSSLWFYRQLFCRLADFKNTFHSGLNISKQYFRLRDIVKDIGSENLTLYSYWFNLPSFALVQLKNLSNVSKVIVRTHRFDLYEEISRLGYHPFKKSFISKFDKIVSISNDGIDYLRNKYTDVDEAKFVVSKLGVQSQAHKDYTFGKELLLVSCSGIRPVKNVPTIAKMIQDFGIKHPDVSLRWLHFGDGDRDIIQKIDAIIHSMPPNVACELKGHITNSDLLEFYKENNVYLFINMSSSEGIPVSIMEAQSFGIPVLATIVGGVGEIIDETNGFPVEEGLYHTYVVALTKALNIEKSAYLKLRRKSYNSMMHDYNSDKNYNKFISEVLL